MSHPEINTEKSAAQPPQDLLHLNRLHRGSLGAYSIARLLRESHGVLEQPLECHEQYGLLLALEFICYDLYAHHEKEIDRAEGGGNE